MSRCLFLRLVIVSLIPVSISGQSIAYDGFCRAVADLDELPPGCWCEVPNSQLRQLEPDPRPPGWGGFGTVVSAWSGGAYDSTRQQLIVWGGGHADYAGNEIYVFDVSQLAWQTSWEHTPIAQIPNESVNFETYPDGNPSARHTYDGLVYIPSLDLFWSQGGALWKNGGLTSATWTFDRTDQSWQRKADAPYTYGSLPLSAFDSSTGHVFHQGQHNFSEYDPVADSWVVRGKVEGGWWSDNFNAAFDAEQRLFVAIGQDTSSTTNELRIWDLSSNSYRVEMPSFPIGLAGVVAPGLAFDDSSDKLVAWGRGTSVFSLDHSGATPVWHEHLAADANLVSADKLEPANAGTFGRFRYMHDRNLFIVVNSVDQNVFIYRLNPGAGVPPDTSSPAPPIGLRVI